MIDTLTLSRKLDQGRPPVRAHADAIATGIQQAADHGDHVTASDLRNCFRSPRRDRHSERYDCCA